MDQPITPVSQSQSQLTEDQLKFVSKLSWSALAFGPIYFFANGLIVEGFLFLVPFYNIYLWIKGFIQGRKMSWQKGEWKSFDSYRRRQRLLGKIAVAYVAIAVIFIATVGTLVYSVLAGVRSASKNFTDDLVSGNVQQAYSVDTSQDFKSNNSATDLQNFADTYHVEHGSFSYDSWEQVNGTAVASGIFTSSAGEKYNFSLSLIKNSSMWEVDAIQIKR